MQSGGDQGRVTPVKVKVRGDAEAVDVLRALSALGFDARSAEGLVRSKRMQGCIAGYRVSRRGVVYPFLRGGESGFESADGAEVSAETIVGAKSRGDLGAPEWRRKERGEERGLGAGGVMKKQGRPTGGAREVLARVPRAGIREDGLLPQLHDLMLIARHLGMSKAADALESGAGLSRAG